MGGEIKRGGKSQDEEGKGGSKEGVKEVWKEGRSVYIHY